MISPENLGADLTNEVFRNRTVYFSAPASFLGKRLTSYGGALNYSIFYTPGPFGTHYFLKWHQYIGTYFLFNSLISYRTI